MDRILVRLPEELEYVLPAISTVQHYISSMLKQVSVGRRDPQFGMRIEAQDVSHLFLTPMMDRLEWVANSGGLYWRMDWDCVLDFRDIDKAYKMAKPTHKHVAEMWGTLMGSNPKKVPYMGYLVFRMGVPDTDVLIDELVEEGFKLKEFFLTNYSYLSVRVEKVSGLRVCEMFDRLSRTGFYIGPRSDASYLAATMGKALLELYSDDKPIWWLDKPRCDIYGLIYGNNFSAENIWCVAQELEGTAWRTFGTKNRGDLVLEGQLVSTAENAAVR